MGAVIQNDGQKTQDRTSHDLHGEPKDLAAIRGTALTPPLRYVMRGVEEVGQRENSKFKKCKIASVLFSSS